MSAIDIHFESQDLPQPQDVVKVKLNSGGIKVGVYRGRGYFSEKPGVEHLALQSLADCPQWWLIEAHYIMQLQVIRGASPRQCSAESKPARYLSLPVATAGDRCLVCLTNQLTYSGYFFGMSKNLIDDGATGILLGFRPDAPLLHWFDPAHVLKVRVTNPAALENITHYGDFIGIGNAALLA
jgi:hypothetical protein